MPDSVAAFRRAQREAEEVRRRADDERRRAQRAQMEAEIAQQRLISECVRVVVVLWSWLVMLANACKAHEIWCRACEGERKRTGRERGGAERRGMFVTCPGLPACRT